MSSSHQQHDDPPSSDDLDLSYHDHLDDDEDLTAGLPINSVSSESRPLLSSTLGLSPRKTTKKMKLTRLLGLIPALIGSTTDLLSRHHFPLSRRAQEFVPARPELSLSFCAFLLLAIALGCSSVAYGFGSSFLVTFTTPYLESQHLPDSLLSLNWLSGPVAAFVGLPLSVLSDRMFCGMCGRRKPWLIVSVGILAVGMTLFPNAHVLAGKGALGARVVAVGAFWLISIGTQWINIFIKALIVDVIPAKNQLSVVNIVLTIFATLGSLALFATGAVPWVAFVGHLQLDVQFVALVSLCVVLVSVSTTVLCVYEKKNGIKKRRVEKKKKEQEDEEVEAVGCWQGLRSLPCVFWGTWIAQFLTYLTKQFVYIYMTTFIGKSVFGGSPTAPIGSKLHNRYSAGLRWASLCFVVASVVGIAYAFVLTPLSKKVSVKAVWLAAISIKGVVFIATSLWPNKWFLMVASAIFGVAQTTMVSIPWTICNVVVKRTEGLDKMRSFVQNVFNASTMLPLVLVSSFSGLLARLFGKVLGHFNVCVSFLLSPLILFDKYLFTLAGSFGVMAAVVILFIKFPKDMKTL